MTPEQLEELFAELRSAPAGTRIKFQLQEEMGAVEGIVIDPPGHRPEGLEEGVFLQDVEDHTQVYCLCPDPDRDSGNILVHTFELGAVPMEKGPSPEFRDEITERLEEAEGVHIGGGANGTSEGAVTGQIDTDAPAPPPLEVAD